MSAISIDKIIDDFEYLTLEDKEYALEIIRKQFLEAKRDAIAKKAKKAKANMKKGLVKRGTLKDLYKDFEGD